MITEEQKRITLLLHKSPKTMEELRKQLNLPYDKLLEELKKLMDLNLIEKKGYPTKYYIKEGILKKVEERKKISEKDPHKIRIQAMIEVQAIEPNLLKKQLKDIEKKLRDEPDFTVYDVEHADPIKEGENFTGFIEINMSVKDFKTLVYLLFFYGPSAIEVIKPSKLEITAGDLQDGLIDMSNMIHGYTNYITKLMTRKELEDFNKKLFD